MTPVKCDAKVLKNERLAGDLCRLTLMAPTIVGPALPGQFVMVRAGEPNTPPLWRRPFSIHQVLAGGESFQLLIKVVGAGTRYLAERRPGERLSLVGPLGHGYDLPNDVNSSPICIVAGGVGAAPLFYLVSSLCACGLEPKKISFFIGGATRFEVEMLAEDLSQLGVTVALSTDDGSAGYHGLVTELFFKTMNSFDLCRVYSCGPHPMMRAVAEYCLERKWPCQVSLETMMACGVSACLGCAVRGADQNGNPGYLHVCKEGPVFDAGEVAWD